MAQADFRIPRVDFSQLIKIKQPKHPVRLTVILIIVVLLILAALYWWFHPAINIHSTGMWSFIVWLILLPLWVFFFLRYKWIQHRSANDAGRRPDILDENGRIKVTNVADKSEKTKKDPAKRNLTKRARFWRRMSFLPLGIFVLFLLGWLLSATFFPGNASRYASILPVENRDFSTDIHEVDYSQIPVIDRDSAVLLGNRVMGEIPEYVSQFNVSSLYSQINYEGRPVRVSPLEYADFFKWFNNRDAGLPAYVLVDMASQDAKIVRLDKGMRYSQSEPFTRNIDRYVQLKYPFYMFDQKSFEIDEDGNPWWICPVQTRRVGLFGGVDITRVVLCNASTGECTDLAVGDCPDWVDRVYPADLLIEQYNWSGALSGGWLNSWLGQSGVVQTTQGANGQLGYNYIAQDDSVWVYTGVTSATSDDSIVGFVLINQRTAEARFYTVSGATESSAMSSAQGQVQHLGYGATFPLLVNVSGQPTYFMALKDNAGLVKMYAMLDIQRYQNVAVGDTIAAAHRDYLTLLSSSGVEAQVPLVESQVATGTVNRIVPAVIDGNSHFFIVLQGDPNIYDCSIPNLSQALLVQVGDEVKLSYTTNEEDNIMRTVQQIQIAGLEESGTTSTETGSGTTSTEN
jgi:hypothetical protein